MTAHQRQPDIERTAASLLRPVLRLLIDRGLSRQALDQLVDISYVEAATDVLGSDADGPSFQAITEKSGVPADRVRDLMEIIEKGQKVRAASLATHAPLVAAAERVMTAWYTDTQFTDKDGQPLPYAIDDSSFDTLVDRFGNSCTAHEIAEFLVTTGSVKKNDIGELVPQRRHVLAAPRSAESAHNALEALTDLAHAIAANQEKQLTGMGALQRTCVNEHIPTRVAPLFRAMIRETTQAFLESIDDWLVQHEAKIDEAPDEPMARLGVGVYVVAEE